MHPFLTLQQANLRPDELRAEAARHRLAAELLGDAPWWRRLLGLPARAREPRPATTASAPTGPAAKPGRARPRPVTRWDA